MAAPVPDRLPAKVRAAIAEAVAAERADLLAYLDRRAGNARRMAAADVTYCEWARDRASQLDIVAGDIRAGLHEGMAGLGPVLDGSVQGVSTSLDTNGVFLGEKQ